MVPFCFSLLGLSGGPLSLSVRDERREKDCKDSARRVVHVIPIGTVQNDNQRQQKAKREERPF